ncbi:zinc ribbon-containing protein [Thalassotalea sp. M1531]|uniref:Zinc ribbon-containing protein n=1 Tax=Thalassotalea algicola TaxID=2716224 RepID=A0A7Y0LB98_9GAMM|nr:hypothetical protein [Thalassotalea algicola]NMP31028.1 zinc ribbon-containing protein [Thalassotalea algicola]
MTEKKSFDDVYKSLNNWLEDVKSHEVNQLVEIVEEAKALVGAAESLSQERVTQFISNFKYDLKEFVQQWQDDSQHSIYLGLLNETWWDTIAKTADKAQIEWAELPDDFAHDGIYRKGDFIGFGQLTCCQCSEVLTISHFSQVGECPQCGNDEFNRVPLSP